MELVASLDPGDQLLPGEVQQIGQPPTGKTRQDQASPAGVGGGEDKKPVYTPCSLA